MSVTGPNLVLVVADTTRADALGLGLGGGVAPALAAAARDGRVYTKATSPAPWTAPAHASMFTGLAPSEHGVWRSNLFGDQGRPVAVADQEVVITNATRADTDKHLVTARLRWSRPALDL